MRDSMQNNCETKNTQNSQKSQEQKRVYLDYGATTPLDKRVADEMALYMQRCGNASSLYLEGKQAASAIANARAVVASSIGCRDPHDVVFTSGATESNNTAIFGIAKARFENMKKSLGSGHVICCAFEHKAVLEPVSQLKRLGFEITFLPPNKDGFISPNDLEAAIRPDTLLVSIMYANNEIGTIQPVEELAEVAHDYKVPIHSDAVGAFGKIPIDVARTKLDSISFTSHKICGPYGIGALYINKKTPFVPLIWGGGQERKLRSGTSNVYGIVGFSKACELVMEEISNDSCQALAKMRDDTIKTLTGRKVFATPSNSELITLPLDIPVGDTTKHLPQLVPLIIRGMGSQELVRKLDELGYAVSGGSACTSSQAESNHVLSSIGITTNDSLGFLRLTFGRFTKEEHLQVFAKDLAALVGSKRA